ncbi:MAG: L-rhamnose mutarotase [Haliea sp.]|nr:L-rhamnose mutarotase [Haliea sp.]
MHANADSVTARFASTTSATIRIFITQLEGEDSLFSYFEYTGTDYEQDMRSVAADLETQRWWRTTDPLPDPANGAGRGN